MLRLTLAALIVAIGLTGIDPLPAFAAATSNQITVKRFQFQGNTVFRDAELEAVIKPWLDQPMGFEALLDVRTAITEHYRQAGYLTSFALLPTEPNQQLNADAATITIQIVEGTITAIDAINPTQFTQTIVNRLPHPQVFNQNRLLGQLQFLKLVPGVRDLQAELLPGDAPGLNRLQLNVLPAPSFELTAGINNQNSVDTGQVQQGLDWQWRQPLGLDDRLTGSFQQTKGGNNWEFGYHVALNPSAKTQLGIDYHHLDQRVVRPPFAAIGIRTKATALNLNLDHVVLQQADHDTLRVGQVGATLSFVNSRSFILDRPFPLTLESNDQGQLKFSVLRCFQTYQQRNARSALALRSQFNLGLPWGNTTGANGVNGQFFTWQGQALLNQSTDWGELSFRLTGQLSANPLPSYEQLNASGIRGYPADTIRGQSGVLLNNELKIPLQATRDRGLFLTPFADVGMLWNPSMASQPIASGGLELSWLTPSGLSAQIRYAIPFIQPDAASWPNHQLNFSVQFKSSF